MKPLAGVLILAAAVAACTTSNSSQPTQAPFSVVEKTIPDMQKAMQDGRVTSRQIVEQYLQRIALYEEIYSLYALNLLDSYR